MEFSNLSTEDGIVQEIDRICGSNSMTYDLKAKAARVNQALDDYTTLALRYDKTWQFDDTNYTNLPIATRNLISGRQDYSFMDELLEVRAVFVKSVGGEFQELSQETDPKNAFIAPSTHGVPNKFRVIGASILLDPISNYDLEGGLKVSFARKMTRFSDSDTTKEPGIPSLFHVWLCQKASLPYLIRHDLESKDEIMALILKGELEIKTFMSKRNAVKPRLTVMQESNK